MFSPDSTKHRKTVREFLWLCFAIVLHAGLLLIPISHEPAMQTSASPVMLTLLVESVVPEPAIEAIKPVQTKLPQEILERPQEEPDELASLEAENPNPLVISSTARLLDSANNMDWPVSPLKKTLQLGIHVFRPFPENWRSGRKVEDNLFNGMVLPRKTEIVDRWLAADGSHNVVINTPGGETLCGRGLPWDPLRPMVEHVMQFRPCAGGGKRSFNMTLREARPRNNR